MVWKRLKFAESFPARPRTRGPALVGLLIVRRVTSMRGCGQNVMLGGPSMVTSCPVHSATACSMARRTTVIEISIGAATWTAATNAAVRKTAMSKGRRARCHEERAILPIRRKVLVVVCFMMFLPRRSDRRRNADIGNREGVQIPLGCRSPAVYPALQQKREGPLVGGEPDDDR